MGNNPSRRRNTIAADNAPVIPPVIAPVLVVPVAPQPIPEGIIPSPPDLDAQKEVGYILDTSETEREWKEKERLQQENAAEDKKDEIPIDEKLKKQKKLLIQITSYPFQFFIQGSHKICNNLDVTCVETNSLQANIILWKLVVIDFVSLVFINF
jgi:hypothetical protein